MEGFDRVGYINGLKEKGALRGIHFDAVFDLGERGARDVTDRLRRCETD